MFFRCFLTLKRQKCSGIFLGILVDFGVILSYHRIVLQITQIFKKSTNFFFKFRCNFIICSLLFFRCFFSRISLNNFRFQFDKKILQKNCLKFFISFFQIPWSKFIWNFRVTKKDLIYENCLKFRHIFEDLDTYNNVLEMSKLMKIV